MSLKAKIGAALLCLVVAVGAVFMFVYPWGGESEEPQVLVGLQSTDGALYYYDENGALLYGWQTIDGALYYFDPVTGAAVVGWYTAADGAVYYFDENGCAVTGDQVIDGEAYSFGTDYKLIVEDVEAAGYTWEVVDGKTYCVGPDGQYVTGLANISGSLYLFDDDGVRLTGWQTVDGFKYYFDTETGRAAKGWMTIDGGTYYFDSDGKALTGNQTIGGKEYKFDDGGKLAAEQTTSSGSSRPGQSSSSSSQAAAVEAAPAAPDSQTQAPVVSVTYTMVTDENGNTYIKSSTGAVLTGLQSYGGKLYYCDPSTGVIQYGKQTVNGNIYIFDSNAGYALSGMVADPANPNNYYYLGTNGVAQKGLQLASDGRLYYLDPDTGVRLGGLILLDSKLYCFEGTDDSALTGWYTAEAGTQALARTTTAATTTYYFGNEFYALTGLQELAGPDGVVRKYGFSSTGEKVSGWRKFDDVYYYFMGQDNSAIVSDWVDHPVDGNAKAYVDENGRLKTGLLDLGGVRYYFDSEGKLYSGWMTVSGAKYYFDPDADGAALKNTWKEDGEGNICYLGSDGVALTGLQTMDGNLYYFTSDGARQSGKQTVDGHIYIFDAQGVALAGIQLYEEQYYYLGGDFYALLGVQQIDGAAYYFNTSTGVREAGWKSENGKKYLFDGEDGRARVGAYSEGNSHYLFGGDGAALSGVQAVDGKYYYYDTTTFVRQTGWKTSGGALYYFDPATAAAVTGWFTDVGSAGIYYFGADGKAATGSQNIDGTDYTFGSDGKLTPTGEAGEDNWVVLGGKTYYVGSNGQYVTGLQVVDGALYYFGSDGARQNGLFKVQGNLYFFNPENDDKGHTGWYTATGSAEEAAEGQEAESSAQTLSKYYFGADGAAYTGTAWIESKFHYFSTDGVMQTGLATLDGYRYYFGQEDGSAYTGWYPGKASQGASYFMPDTFQAATGIQLVGDEMFLFDDAGVRQRGWHKDEYGALYCFKGTNDAAIRGNFFADSDTGETYYLTPDGYALVGLWHVNSAGPAEDGPLYYFTSGGAMQTGFARINGKLYYFSDSGEKPGAAVGGEQIIDGKTYFFHEADGYALTGTHEMADGNTYVFDVDGVLLSKTATEGHSWKWVDGELYYTDSAGGYYTGLTEVDGSLYFFEDGGKARAGWATIAVEGTDRKFYFGDDDRKALGGWFIDGDDRYYFDVTNHWAVTGEVTIGTRTYVFDDEGVLQGGDTPPENFNEWIQTADSWVYYDQNGDLAIGLNNIGGLWYLFDEDGLRLSGRQEVEGSFYYFGGANDAAVTGWVVIPTVLEDVTYDAWYLFDGSTGKQMLEWQVRDGEDGVVFKHYFDKQTGLPAIGWVKINGYDRYFMEDGHMAVGWQQIGDDSYYFFDSGIMATGVVTIDGELYSFSSDGRATVGWNTDADGYRYYFDDGKALTGWQQINEYVTPAEDITEETEMAARWYSFEANGRQKLGWQLRYTEEGETHRFFYDAKGALPQPGWGMVSSLYRYTFEDGHVAVGWNTINGKTYYFSSQGELATGTTTIGGVTYPLGEDGELQLGWYTGTGGSRYHFTEKGASTGWVQITTELEDESYELWYLFDSRNGSQQTGWQKRTDENAVEISHYFYTDGSSAFGWTDFGTVRRYFQPDGSMTTGWLELDGNNYYFMPSDGSMATGVVEIDGARYSFDENGLLIEGWNTGSDGKRYYFSEDGVLKGWNQIDGKWYYLDEASGAQQLGWQKRVSGDRLYYYYYFSDGNLPAAGWNANIDGVNRYVLADGQMAQGMTTVGKSNYCFSLEGVPLTGWQQVYGRWYVMGSDGAQLTGFQSRILDNGYVAGYYYNTDGSLPAEGWHDSIEGKRRYVMADGELAQGWQNLEGHTYYFDPYGIPRTGQQTINGVQYAFDALGRYISPPTITLVEYERGSGAQKQVTVTARAGSLLENQTIEYSFDSGATWSTSNTKSFAAGTTLAAGAIRVRDALGSVTSYNVAITLDNAFTMQNGIDVSSHQGYIDWAAVAASGQVDFAIIRGLTWSGGLSGYYCIDENFAYNVRTAKAYGIKVGAYLYSYAFNDDEMIEEVVYFMNSPEVQGLLRDGIYFDLPVFIDYEDTRINTYTNDLVNHPSTFQTTDQRTESIRIGMALIEQLSGYKFRPGFYLSRSWATTMVNATYLQKLGYDFWLAHWGITAHGWSPSPSIWQYNNGTYFGDTGVPGISGRVDRNYGYVDYSSLIDGGKTPAPSTAVNLTVTDQSTNTVVTLTAEEMLSQIVMAEVGGFANAEVYKAQAVAAHSYLMYQYAQGYSAPSVALKSPTAAVRSAVSAVSGEILTYNGQYALTTYYAYSNGYTNNAKYWNSSNNLPYLTTVSSSYDTSKGAYSAQVSQSVVQARLEAIYGSGITSGVSPENWIKVTGRNSGNYVTSLLICGARTPGVEYFYLTIIPYMSGSSRIYPIRSPDFDVSYSNGVFTFTSRGYGHCIGMSQTGAYGLAQQGYSYQQILAHYYPGTTITKRF